MIIQAFGFYGGGRGMSEAVRKANKAANEFLIQHEVTRTMIVGEISTSGGEVTLEGEPWATYTIEMLVELPHAIEEDEEVKVEELNTEMSMVETKEWIEAAIAVRKESLF